MIKTWKRSTDPDYEAKKNRVLQLYAIADGQVTPAEGDPTVVFCLDEFGPLNLQPHPGKQWATRGGGTGSPRRRRRATYTRPHGVRHLLAGYDLSRDPARAGSSSSPSAATCAASTRRRCASPSCSTTSART